MVQGAELLAFGAFLHIFSAVSLDSRPIVVGSEDLSSHRSGSRMVAAYPLLYLREDILGPFSNDALE